METRSKPKHALKSEAASRGRTHVVRSEPRVRTHLRTGQILDSKRNVLSECLILDVSLHGARIKLHKQGVVPPKLLLIYDERSQGILDAEMRWHRNNEIGIFVRNGTLSLVQR